ncbi:MAG TPA: cytochrome c oxidase subunit II [Rhodothermales bacterium]|nr:cytochrome c oxidase subunit II [Rhodothermales bacterium]
MFDLSKYLGMPFDASSHGYQIDFMMGLVHWLMLFLFLIWAPFFIYTLVRFRKKKNPVANYVGSKSKMSTYLEVGIVVAEVVLLFGFAFPQWAYLKNEFPPEEEATRVHVVAEQFAWNFHYPGPDGIFGQRSPDLVDTALNPLGLNPDDPNGQDDIATVNELHLPVNKPVIVMLSSKDVIHSFALPTMRVKQDAIPGLTIPVWFEPIHTGEWEISCAQLCGLSHYRMRGFITVESEEDFAAWLEEMAAF